MSSLESLSDRSQKLWVEPSSLAETFNGEEAFTLLGHDCSTPDIPLGSNAPQSHMGFATKEVKAFKDASNVDQDHLGYSLDRWLDQGLREDPWNLMSGLQADSKILCGSRYSTSCPAFLEPCEHVTACTPSQPHSQFSQEALKAGSGLIPWFPTGTSNTFLDVAGETMSPDWSNAATTSGSPVDDDNSFNDTKNMLEDQTSNLSKDFYVSGTNDENNPRGTAKESCAVLNAGDSSA